MANFDIKDLRNAFGNFATGVCVVAATDIKGNAVGMTINSFSSVSLDPTLVLWNIKRNTISYEIFSGIEKFSINILSAAQKDVSSRYATYGDHVMHASDYGVSERGIPVVNDSLGYFECGFWSSLEAGDHDIIIGNVLHYSSGDYGAPLVFYKGRYCLLDEVPY